MTTPEISREATDPTGTTTYPNRDPRHYGTNLAKPQPDPDDATKVAFHDHDGHDGHADKDHGHYVGDLTSHPGFELTIVGETVYVPPVPIDNKDARSRVTLTAGHAIAVATGKIELGRFSAIRPDLYLTTTEVYRSQPQNDLSVRETEVDGLRQFTVELPIAYENVSAFLATSTAESRGMPSFVGPMIKLPLPAVAPAEESSDGC